MALKNTLESIESSSPKEPRRPWVAADTIFGEMYGQWAMDVPIVETVMGVARDFVERPSYFTRVPDDVAILLEDLWYRSGSDPRFPDRSKRAAMFGAVFGACDCASDDD